MCTWVPGAPNRPKPFRAVREPTEAAIYLGAGLVLTLVSDSLDASVTDHSLDPASDFVRSERDIANNVIEN
jgi:hypothetical protein